MPSRITPTMSVNQDIDRIRTSMAFILSMSVKGRDYCHLVVCLQDPKGNAVYSATDIA